MVDGGGNRAVVRPPLHDPARPRAASARRRAPRDRRGGRAAARRDVDRHGRPDALLAALRHELRGARAPVTYLADRAAAVRARLLVAARRARALARADDGAVAARAALVAAALAAFLLPGLALQRLTTREPTLDETQVALRAVAAVLRARASLSPHARDRDDAGQERPCRDAQGRRDHGRRRRRAGEDRRRGRRVRRDGARARARPTSAATAASRGCPTPT